MASGKKASTAKKSSAKKSSARKSSTRKSSARKSELANEIAQRLSVLYPGAECELTHANPYELLAATILSAQCTDARVNMVTPNLFAKYPTAYDLANANPQDVEEIVKSTGFYQNKTKNLIGMAQNVVERFNGEVPKDLEDLVTLPGVGRKTGNVVRSVVFDLPGLAVDTHVGRLSRRLGLTREEDPVKVEYDLNAQLAPEEWGKFSLRLILHGRRVCDARKPRCEICELNDICPSSNLPMVMEAARKKAAQKKAAARKKAQKSTQKSTQKAQKSTQKSTQKAQKSTQKAAPRKPKK